MYQEICKKSKISYIKMILIILAFYIVILVSKYAFSLSNISTALVDVGILLFIAIVIYYFVIKNMIYYKYSIIGEELIISKVLGINEKAQVSIHKDQIIEIVEKNKNTNYSVKISECDSKLKLHTKTIEKIYYCFYVDCGKKKMIEIQPTQELLVHIK
jgi:hypothetical protein